MKLAMGSLTALLMLAVPALAQSPAVAPVGSTGLCKDGTYWSGKLKLGACHGHKGVQTWYGAAPAARMATPSAARAPMPMAAAPMAAAPMTASSSKAAGGGAGQVWVNTKSKVYHCQSDPFYGKTKKGQYMTEAAALQAGAHADHGKACG
jgi:hypothetical protein